jgi:hypothetical protein
MRSEKDVIERLERDGYIEHFTVHEGALKSTERGDSFGPRDVAIRQFARYEGVSDPDDMSIVYAIETRDGRRGTLTDGFGVYSSPGISAFVESVEKPTATPVVPVDVGTPPGPPAPGR